MSCNATRTLPAFLRRRRRAAPVPKDRVRHRDRARSRRTRPTRSLRHPLRHDASHHPRLAHQQCRFAPQRPWRNIRRGCDVVVPACSRHAPGAGASRADQMVPFGVFRTVDAADADVNQRAVAVILYPQTGLVGRDLCWAGSTVVREEDRSTPPTPPTILCADQSVPQRVDARRPPTGEQRRRKAYRGAQEPTPEVGAHAPFCRVMTRRVPAEHGSSASTTESCQGWSICHFAVHVYAGQQ